MARVISRYTFYDHQFSDINPLKVQLWSADTSVFDSICQASKVTSVYTVFFFDADRSIYQFKRDSSVESAERRGKGGCAACGETVESMLICSVLFGRNGPKRKNSICEDCLSRFLEIHRQIIEKNHQEVVLESL